jgi:hypothetical protein
MKISRVRVEVAPDLCIAGMVRLHVIVLAGGRKTEYTVVQPEDDFRALFDVLCEQAVAAVREAMRADQSSEDRSAGVETTPPPG